MLRPVIFIGCGGSGTKAVRYVRDAVLRRLEHRGWARGMPEAWQFIGLDTLTVQESPTEIPTIPAADFLSLSATFDSYRGLQEALTLRYPVRGALRNARPLCGWLPDPRSVNIPLKDGAGQNRGIGPRCRAAIARGAPCWSASGLPSSAQPPGGRSCARWGHTSASTPRSGARPRPRW